MKIPYFKKDYTSIREELVNLAKEQLTEQQWSDFNESDIGMTIIELFASLGDLLAYNIDHQANELYMDRAQERKNIVSLANLINYKIEPNTPAIGEVTITNRDISSTSLPILIEGETELQATYNATSYKFIISSLPDNAVFEPNKPVSNIGIIQGEWLYFNPMDDYSTTFASLHTQEGNTLIDYYFDMNSFMLEIVNNDWIRNYFTVLINGEKWTQVDSFISSKPSDTHYVLETTPENHILIKFGDNINGKKPSLNDRINIKFLITKGREGNISANSINAVINGVYIENPSYDPTSPIPEDRQLLLPLTSFNLEVEQEEPTRGGEYYEDTEFIRKQAPAELTTLHRGVTKEDLLTLTNGFPGIRKSLVWGEYEEIPMERETFVQPPVYDIEKYVPKTVFSLEPGTDLENVPDTVKFAEFTDALTSTTFRITRKIGDDANKITNVKFEYIKDVAIHGMKFTISYLADGIENEEIFSQKYQIPSTNSDYVNIFDVLTTNVVTDTDVISIDIVNSTIYALFDNLPQTSDWAELFSGPLEDQATINVVSIGKIIYEYIEDEKVLSVSPPSVHSYPSELFNTIHPMISNYEMFNKIKMTFLPTTNDTTFYLDDGVSVRYNVPDSPTYLDSLNYYIPYTLDSDGNVTEYIKYPYKIYNVTAGEYEMAINKDIFDLKIFKYNTLSMGNESKNIVYNLLSYLDTIKVITTSIFFVQPRIVPIGVNIRIRRKPDASASAVQLKVRQAIKDFFDISVQDFGKTIRYSDLVNVVESVDGVDYCYVQLKKWDMSYELDEPIYKMETLLGTSIPNLIGYTYEKHYDANKGFALSFGDDMMDRSDIELNFLEFPRLIIKSLNNITVS